MSVVWDRFQFDYRAPANASDVELPLRLLLLDDFSGQRAAVAQPVEISASNFDQVLRERRIALRIGVENRLLPEADTPLDFTFQPQALGDFAPEALVQSVPALGSASALLADLRVARTELARGELYAVDELRTWQDAGMIASLGLRAGISLEALDYAQAELAQRLAEQLDAVLHHEAFQALEAAWRSVKLVVDQVGAAADCRIDLLDCDKEQLREDFAAHTLFESHLYRLVYSGEFGQFGGEPYAAVICGYPFEPTEDDVALLRAIAGVASLAHAPFIANAGPRLLGVRRFDQLASAGSLTDLHRSPLLARWRGFTEEKSSAYVALTLPRVVLREPYARVVAGADYREEVAEEAAHLLWGAAAYAFAGCLVRSFEAWRVCVDIIGRSGGRVDGLPKLHGRLPLEFFISETREADLVGLGLMPLVADRGTGELAFYAANSVHWHDVAQGDAALGEKLGVQLPYVFLISRIAHYLKVVQRDSLGANKGPDEIRSELTGWLKRYVSDVENPEAAVRARRPLRKAELEVEQVGEGAYRMRLSVTPHFKYIGQDYTLGLEGPLGPAAGG